MKQQVYFQKRVKDKHDELIEEVIETSAGNGAVSIDMLGDFTVKSIDIKDEIISVEDKSNMEELLKLAINKGVKTII